MTDIQILTIALSVVVPVSLLLLNNSRITDMKGTLDARITDAKETLRAEMKTNQAEVIAAIDRIGVQIGRAEENLEAKLRIHELEHHR